MEHKRSRSVWQKKLSTEHFLLASSDGSRELDSEKGVDLAVKLRFCPNSNDLLYPKEDRERQKLVYVCRNCDYMMNADSDCVYRNSIAHTSDEVTAVIQDVRGPDYCRDRTMLVVLNVITERQYFSR